MFQKACRCLETPWLQGACGSVPIGRQLPGGTCHISICPHLEFFLNRVHNHCPSLSHLERKNGTLEDCIDGNTAECRLFTRMYCACFLQNMQERPPMAVFTCVPDTCGWLHPPQQRYHIPLVLISCPQCYSVIRGACFPYTRGFWATSPIMWGKQVLLFSEVHESSTTKADYHFKVNVTVIHTHTVLNDHNNST